MNLIRTLIISALIGLLGIGAVIPTSAQTATPTTASGTFPDLPGVTGAALVEYLRTCDEWAPGTSFYQFVAVSFDTLEHAEAARPYIIAFVEDFEEKATLTPLAPTSVETYGDELLAFTGAKPVDAYTLHIAIVFLRDGPLWRFGFATGARATPLVDLSAVIKTVQTRGTIAISPEDLAGTLPTLDDMPPGFIKR